MAEVGDGIRGQRPFDLVLGRKTYEIFAAQWPHVGDARGAKPFNGATRHVASLTLTSLEWQNSTGITCGLSRRSSGRGTDRSVTEPSPAR